MKTKISVVIMLFLFLFSVCSYSQEVVDPQKEVKKEGTKRVNKNIDKSVDQGFDKIEEGIGKLFGKKKKNKESQTAENPQVVTASQQQEQPATPTPVPGEYTPKPELNWAKYDFVPGDKVIFEDDLLGEENGEFPSRWDLVRGNAEVAKFGEDMVIMLRDGAPSIIPYFKSPRNDYLPEVFTIEFDLYYPGNGYFQAYLYDRKNQKSDSPTGYTYVQIGYNQMEMGQVRSTLPDKNVNKSRWMHIAIAYTSGKLKAYMDETRLLNIPRLDFEPKGLTLYTYHARNDNLYYVKNIRVAEGGVKYYDRVLQDGKIIATGIRFDVGKATLKPESMGIINKVTQLMQDHPELKFSVEGHTDSDGEDSSNLTLSEERAQTVKNTMIKLGISPDRLTTKGLGETTPMDTNDTPEGKANNRRVEFVKI